jgi:hypothetical protein
VVVFDIEFQFVPPSVEDSHPKTLPVCPLKVRVPLLIFEHRVMLLFTLPPTLSALIVKAAEIRGVIPEALPETFTLYDELVIAVDGMGIIRVAFVGSVKVPLTDAITFPPNEPPAPLKFTV